MRYSLLLLGLLLTQQLISQPNRPEIHCKHFFYGYPFGAPASNDLIIRDIYALSNNDSTKFADWVTYRLTMHEVDGDLTVERKWTADPWLDENETLEPSGPDDYDEAHDQIHTDRGHQAPLASFKGSRHASHTNYLSNITPQKSDLNQGVWKDLESKIRDLVREIGEVYVMTGPVYDRTMPSLPTADETHHIPSAYWKIICVEEEEEIRVAAFLFDQETQRNDLILDHQVTIDSIEQITGLDFLWMLEDIEENSLESQVNTIFSIEYFNQ